MQSRSYDYEKEVVFQEEGAFLETVYCFANLNANKYNSFSLSISFMVIELFGVEESVGGMVEEEQWKIEEYFECDGDGWGESRDVMVPFEIA